MAEQTQHRSSPSLDSLLTANRERFDDLFKRQMNAALPPLVPTRRPASRPTSPPPAPVGPAASPEMAKPARTTRSVLTAELNKRFTFTWSSEILDRRIENGRATVRCRLKVGNRERVEGASSRIASDDDREAAFERAYDAALQACASHFLDEASGRVVLEPLAAPPSPDRTPAEQARLALARARPVDGIDIDRLQAALAGLCAEMECVRARGTPTDASVGALLDRVAGTALIADADGQMVAGGFGSYVAHLIAHAGLRFAPGDVLLHGDPYLSGGATGCGGEWLVLMPVFMGDRQIGFTSMAAPLAGHVGSGPARTAFGTRAMVDDGVRIPPIRIFEAGVLNEAALQVILHNVGAAQANRAALLAMVAGCRAGAAGILRLCERLGGERYRQTCAALLARSEQAMRRRIREVVPEEPQSFEDQVDDDGCGNGPFRLRLTVWREGDHAYFDWTGSAMQAPGPINVRLPIGLAKMLAGRLLAGPAASQDAGFHDLLHVTLPEGSILNPAFPAAVGRGAVTLERHLDVLSSALARHRPDDLAAAGPGAHATFRFAGTDASGGRFTLTDRIGIRAGHTDADVETLERDVPVVIEHCALVADTGGAGRIPGANAIEKTYRILAAGSIGIEDDRHASQAWGVNGGRAGARSAKWRVRPDGTREALGARIDRQPVDPGDRIVFRIAGGGGSGDPLERDANLVREDVRRGLLSIEAAAREHGVVLRGAPLEVDTRATRELRDRARRERTSLPLFDHGDAV